MISYGSKLLKVFGFLKMAQVRTFYPNKPPTVMVYADEKHFAYLKRNLYKCLPSDKYIIYQLTSVDRNANLWKDNTQLLIIFSNALDSKINENFLQYVECGGKLLSFCSNLSCPNIILEDTQSKEGVIRINYENTSDVSAFRGQYSFISAGSEILSYDNNGKSVIYKTILKEGICIISEVHLAIEPEIFKKDYIPVDGDEKHLKVLRNILFEHFQLEETALPESIPSLSPGYVMTEVDQSLSSFMDNLKITEIPVDKFSQYLFSDEERSDAKPQSIVPYNLHPPKLSFDKNLYFSKLKTEKFGRQLIYFPVIHTTMIADLFSHCDGLVIVAGEQLTGRGRGGNKWISSAGCAMFTLHVTVPLSSYVGQHLSILQHVPALAVVHSIKSLDGCDYLNLNIKWPNDIYFGKECKIGGVLMNSTIQNNLAHVYIGIGINVSNSHPTTCLNDVLKACNTSNSKSLRIEEVIAYVLNCIEYLVNDLNKSGPSLFLNLYYSSWMHEKQKVKIASENDEGTILGIDEYGFLVVKTDGGQKLVLQPDGNSFDIMKNLITLK